MGFLTEVCWFLFISVSATLIKSGSTSTCFPCQTCHMLVLTFLACGGGGLTDVCDCRVTEQAPTQHQEHHHCFESHVIRINSSWTRTCTHTTGLQQLKGKGLKKSLLGLFTKAVFVCCCVNPTPLLSCRTSVFLFKPHGSWWICDELPLLFTDLEAVVLFLGTGEI